MLALLQSITPLEWGGRLYPFKLFALFLYSLRFSELYPTADQMPC